ncbi:MAG: type II toxin-antitoxin system VapC family toxin [Gammaproteobacteria bacterium]|nr:type II toxin-antitoxin system VapC family toxin [Gammaproteobacteria bacterium]
MTTRFLLDTNVVSEPLRPHPATTIMRKLRDHDGEMATQSLVWHELRFGCARLPKSRRREAIERYLDDVITLSFPILDYDQRAADWHALERAPLFVDGQIAAIAHVNELILVTSNKPDFTGFRGLQVKSW